MDTEKKPFRDELLAMNIVVGKYSGAMSSANVAEPLEVGKEVFVAYAKKEGVVLHRDLPDAQGTVQSPELGGKPTHTTTDKEEYLCFHPSGIRSFRYVARNE